MSIPVKPATQSNPNRPPNITQAGNLLHEEEDEAFGDSGYRGVEKREELTENRAYWFMEECSSLTALMSCNLNWSLNMERLFKSYLHTELGLYNKRFRLWLPPRSSSVMDGSSFTIPNETPCADPHAGCCYTSFIMRP